MGKNILIFADGTGNEGGLLPDESRTNVYKLYRATRVDPESNIDPDKQVAFYIPGIGTPTPGGHTSLWKRTRDALDQAVGGGLTQKITECYVAIISAWRPGDRIYLFGFSRGAYTVRCLAHVLEQMGIPTVEKSGSPISLNPTRLYPLARSAVRLYYRLGMTTADNEARDQKAAEFRQMHAAYAGPEIGVVPYFIGVWDTVASIGWQRFLTKNHEETHLPKGVMFVRHAMAIDEYRKDYNRVRWGSAHTIRQKVAEEPDPFLQVWFAGNHADVGGSYPENESRLSDITLKWMKDFVTGDLPESARVLTDERYLNLHPTSSGMMHDECMVGVKGTGVPWSKKVRPVDEEGNLHDTVYERLALKQVRNFDSYGPYRPANLLKHPKAKLYWESPVGV